MAPLPPIVREPAVALLFSWLLAALGYRITRLLRLPLAVFTPWEKAVLCGAIGTGFLQYLPFALGALGKLSVTSSQRGYQLHLHSRPGLR